MEDKHRRLEPIPFDRVKVLGGLWKERIDTVRNVTTRACAAKCEETGRVDNFRKASGRMKGEFRGIFFDDADVYKTIEAIGYVLRDEPDDELRAIADKLGLELHIDDMDFTASLEAAQKGMSDMVMAGVTVDEDRLAVMDFSNSYATGVQVIIVKEGSDVTLDNLGEQLIGVQNGTTGWQYCTDDFGSEHVAAFDNGITAVQALMNDQVDCVVIDQAPAQSFVEQNPGLTILDTEYAVEDYAIGVAKGNTSLLNAINTVLEELQADGTIQSIIDKYIPAE